MKSPIHLPVVVFAPLFLILAIVKAAEAPTLPATLTSAFWKDNAIYHTLSEQLQSTYTDKQKSIIDSMSRQYQQVVSDQTAMDKWCQENKAKLAGLDKDNPHCELPAEAKPSTK